MRKITALCLLISALLMNITAFSAQSGNELTAAEKFMTGSGIFDMDYEPDRLITRAEFAAVFANALGITNSEKEKNDKWQSLVSGEDTTSVSKTAEGGIFEDVDLSHPYYYEIKAVKDCGVMRGISDNLFAPEHSITLKEAQKVIVSLMGYSVYAENKGGYPFGYTSCAEELGLSKGISHSANDAVSQRDVINLIYNALDVQLLEYEDLSSGKVTKSDKTFMSGVLKIGKQKGIMTDNGYTAIRGESAVACGFVTVGGVSARLSEKQSDKTDYIGREVYMYYKTDDDENTAIYIEQTNSCTVNTFDIEDFESIGNGYISYSANGKKVTKRLDKNAEVIVNNEYQKSYDSSTFDFTDGYADVILNGGVCTAIVVYKFEFAVVSGIDADGKCIYTKASGEKYDLSGRDISEDAIVISDEVSGRISFDDIKTGDILNVRKSRGFIGIERGGKKIDSFSVTSISSDDGKTIISGNGEEYETSKAVTGYKGLDTLRTGQSYKLFINAFGRVFWYESADNTIGEDKVGIFCDIKYDDEEAEGKQYSVKLYTGEKSFLRLYSDDKILINGSKLKFENAASIYSGRKGEAVLYSTDDFGKLTKLVFASRTGEDSGLGWYKIADKNKYRYESDQPSFSTVFYVGSSTKKFTVPSDNEYKNDIKSYSFNSTHFTSKDYTVEAYSADKDAVNADVVVVYENKSSTDKTYYIEQSRAFLVESISEIVNEDGENVTKFSGYEFNLSENVKKAEYAVCSDAVMVNSQTNAKEVSQTDSFEITGPKKYSDITPGDIVYFSLNHDNEIEALRMAYDSSEKRPFNANCHTTADFYDSDYAGGYLNCDNTTWSGKIISKSGTGVKIATNYKPQSINFADYKDVEKNVKSVIIRNTGSILIVEGSGNKLTVKSASVEDLRTYKDTGSEDFSDNAVFLAYRRSLNYGSIIYREN